MNRRTVERQAGQGRTTCCVGREETSKKKKKNSLEVVEEAKRALEKPAGA